MVPAENSAADSSHKWRYELKTPVKCRFVKVQPGRSQCTEEPYTGNELTETELVGK